MMNLPKKYVLSTVALLVGIGTITLFQNCSSGSTPNLDDQQSTSSAPVTTPDIYIFVSPNPVTSGASAALSITGGNSVFQMPVSVCGGTVSKNSDGSYSFLAPSGLTAITSCSITVMDTAGKSGTTNFNISPAASTTPVVTTPTAPASLQIYETVDIALAGTTMYTANQNELANNPGVAHHFLASDASAGGVALYRCTVATGFRPNYGTASYYVDSTQSNCEGRTQVKAAVLLGYIYSNSSVANTKPLYRYSVIQNLMGFQWVEYHETFDKATADGSGRSDGVLGYVPIN